MFFTDSRYTDYTYKTYGITSTSVSFLFPVATIYIEIVMAVTHIGRIDKLEIGLTAATNTDMSPILLNWERNHDVRPRLFANAKTPTTYQQPHSWVVGSFSLLSDNHPAIYATDVQAAGGSQYAMTENADSNVIDFLQVTYRDANNVAHTTRFYYAIIYRYTKELLNYDDSVWIYYFLAGYAVDV